MSSRQIRSAARRYRQQSNARRRTLPKIFDTQLARLIVLAVPPAKGAFARHCLSRSGCGVPRAALQVAPGRLWKPALRHYERTRGARMMLGSKDPQCLRGTGRHKSRGGAPRGERPTSLGARRDVSRLRACVTGPSKGAAAPERLSALRSLARCEGRNAKLGGADASREG
jgi:hypothetical protein